MISCGVRRMKNKVLIGIVLTVLFSAAIFFWYTSGATVSIVSLEFPSEAGFPPEVGTLNTGFLYITLQNNASKDVNVTLQVKNALEDENGNSIPSYLLVYGSDGEEPTISEPIGEVKLQPGKNEMRVFFGYQVPGLKKLEVEVYQRGKLVDARSVEIKVLPPIIGVSLQYVNESRSGYDIHKVFGNLSNTGIGTALGVEVNISIINETTKEIVSSTTRRYSLDGFEFSYPMSVWVGRDKTKTTPGPIAIIELSSGVPSDESYSLASTVAKGKIGDRYRVVVIAKWQDQIANAEMMIPP